MSGVSLKPQFCSSEFLRIRILGCNSGIRKRKATATCFFPLFFDVEQLNHWLVCKNSEVHRGTSWLCPIFPIDYKILILRITQRMNTWCTLRFSAITTCSLRIQGGHDLSEKKSTENELRLTHIEVKRFCYGYCFFFLGLRNLIEWLIHNELWTIYNVFERCILISLPTRPGGTSDAISCVWVVTRQ